MPGKKKFPDLTGDGKVTKADILKGRGVEGFERGGKVKIERINKKGRTAAAEKMLRRLGEMKQGSIQEKYPTKGTRPRQAIKPTEKELQSTKALEAMMDQDKYPTKGKRTKGRPPQFEKHRDPGAVERMMEFERSAREAGFKDGGSVCAGGRSALRGKKFSGTY